MKYKAIYFHEGKDKDLGTFKTHEDAINVLIKAGDNNYCLDSRDERIEALRLRNFCMCGCGPNSMKIEEIN